MTPRQTIWLCFCAYLAILTISIIPAAWITLLVGYLKPYVFPNASPSAPMGILKSIAWYYCHLEVAFSIYLFFLTRRVQARIPPPSVNHDDLKTLLNRCLAVGLDAHESRERKETPEEEVRLSRERFRRWFHNAPLEDIKAGNCKQWLSWAFGGLDLPHTGIHEDEQHLALLDEGLEMLQNRLKWEFPPGFNLSVTCLRLNLDGVKTMMRPLAYYIVCNTWTSTTILWLRWRGFRRVFKGKCEFLVLPPQQSKVNLRATRSAQNSPILFLHGLGVGLGQYLVFLQRLVNHQAGVVILVQPHISAGIWYQYFLNPPTKEEHLQGIKEIMKENHFDGKATILSHSNGTMVHAWLSREIPQLGHRHILVDPVCFRLWEGATCFAFIGKKWTQGIEILLGYFVAQEVGNAFTIARRFDWVENAFWIKDLGDLGNDKVKIVIGEKDVLIESQAVWEYLVDEGVPQDAITICPGAQHGENLFMPSAGMKHVCELLQLDSGLKDEEVVPLKGVNGKMKTK